MHRVSTPAERDSRASSAGLGTRLQHMVVDIADACIVHRGWPTGPVSYIPCAGLERMGRKRARE